MLGVGRIRGIRLRLESLVECMRDEGCVWRIRSMMDEEHYFRV